MSGAAAVLTAIPALIQLVEAGVTVVPELIAAAKTELGLITSTSAPTPDQQAAIDAAADAAEAALQAAQPSG